MAWASPSTSIPTEIWDKRLYRIQNPAPFLSCYRFIAQAAFFSSLKSLPIEQTWEVAGCLDVDLLLYSRGGNEMEMTDEVQAWTPWPQPVTENGCPSPSQWWPALMGQFMTSSLESSRPQTFTELSAEFPSQYRTQKSWLYMSLHFIYVASSVKTRVYIISTIRTHLQHSLRIVGRTGWVLEVQKGEMYNIFPL